MPKYSMLNQPQTFSQQPARAFHRRQRTHLPSGSLTHNPLSKAHSPASRQHGIVLMVSLFALMVMAFTALTVWRSMQDQIMLSKNIAIGQYVDAQTNLGIEKARAWLASTIDTTLSNTDCSKGYHSSKIDPMSDPAFKWEGGSDDCKKGFKVSGTPADVGVHYVIERLCLEKDKSPYENIAPTQRCIYSDLNGSTLIATDYRVTVRVSGPNNTISYTQIGFHKNDTLIKAFSWQKIR